VAEVEVMDAEQAPGRLPPAERMIVANEVRVCATSAWLVRHASAVFPHAVKLGSRAKPAGSFSAARVVRAAA